ncbi:hypothetical protein Hanom_Chr12g01160401 [Helianthus anomalus]
MFQRLHRLLVNQSFSFNISIYNQLKLIKVVRNLHLPSFLPSYILHTTDTSKIKKLHKKCP